jgi:hypothetical protein
MKTMKLVKNIIIFIYVFIHQEPTTALTASGFTLERGGGSVVSYD